MELQEIASRLNLEIKSAAGSLTNQVTGGYASDLLSDVIAHAQKGDVWITLQMHQNIVAVATLKELAGVILVNGRQPEEDTLQKAIHENVSILVSNLSTFELAGRLYQLGIKNDPVV
ncbi:serine kinase [bacterium]|nr:serine kinase [bacterium]MBU1752528.1 serine kinase [bacterium]